MEREGFSEQTIVFLRRLAATGETWLVEEVHQMAKQAADEEDFIEELNLYIARLEMKVKTLKEEFEKNFGTR